jgi:hypothetical protein
MGTPRMDVLTACRLSRFGQAGYENGSDFYLAESRVDLGRVVYQVHRKNQYRWQRASAGMVKKFRGKWEPIAPKP